MNSSQQPLQVGIDIGAVIYGRGVSRYTSNLVRALAKQPGIELSLFGSSWRQKNQLLKFANSIPQAKTTQIWNLPPKALAWCWQWGLQPVRSSLPDIDVFHSWDWLQPPDKDLPLVSTIHDLAILKYPDTAHPQILAAHQQSWKVLKQRNAHLIAVSQTTKQDIVELLDYPAQRVHVIYEALPSEQKQVMDTLDENTYQQIVEQLKIEKPFLLFVGTREPRKNLARLIEAWLPLAKEVELLIVGAAGWDDSATHHHPGLRFMGRVDDRALAVLYEEATAFVYPSLDEGFGLPILEAFSHGTPVITSNVSAMLEVAGQAAELVDPFSVESIRAGISVILNETTTQQQQRLQKMMIRLHLFDWQKVADATSKIYQLAFEEKS